MRFNVMTGAIFEEDPRSYPRKIAKLNKSLSSYEPGRVKELYGSMQSSKALPTARPDFRIPDIDLEYLSKYVEECHNHGILFNYTMNANWIGDLEDISGSHEKWISILLALQMIGVDRVTVAHPILLDLVCKHTELPIEVSTIMNVSSLQAPREIKSRYPNVNKICLGIDKVRNIAFVSRMGSVCNELGIDLEIMVSEFCAIGTMSCTNLHRNTCYNLHSMNMDEDVARKGLNHDGTTQPDGVKGYPWSSGKTGCIFGRGVAPESWLASRTIWPNDIEAYAISTGIRHIKVTNRTAPPEFALQLTEYYCKGEYEGLLAGLWLALPASLKSARERFDILQKQGAESVPFTCHDLSAFANINAMLPFRNEFVGRANFMTPFFEMPEVDWNDVVWVDKPNADCLNHESNWIHVWIKHLKQIP